MRFTVLKCRFSITDSAPLEERLYVMDTLIPLSLGVLQVIQRLDQLKHGRKQMSECLNPILYTT